MDASLVVLRVDRVFHPCDLWGKVARRRQDSGRICQYSVYDLWLMTLAGPKSFAHDEFQGGINREFHCLQGGTSGGSDQMAADRELAAARPEPRCTGDIVGHRT